MNQLERLKNFTTVVADTGDFGKMEEFKPKEATTNPSLILKASKQKEYANFIDKTLSKFKNSSKEEKLEQLLIKFGIEILKIVPGRVSTEVDAELSFETDKTIEKARKIISLYEENGINRKRILIKIASTWEGIQAAKVLQSEGITCNMTLLFSLAQAIACANVKATLISPFVGRILDWQKAKEGKDIQTENDMGVKSVKSIYNYYKSRGINTEVMGASFRNKNQVIALAGCDLLTISPELLEELKNSTEEFERQLSFDPSSEKEEEEILSEAKFRFLLNEDAMATEKLAEGIRNFHKDTTEIYKLL